MSKRVRNLLAVAVALVLIVGAAAVVLARSNDWHWGGSGGPIGTPTKIGVPSGPGPGVIPATLYAVDPRPNVVKPPPRDDITTWKGSGGQTDRTKIGDSPASMVDEYGAWVKQPVYCSRWNSESVGGNLAFPRMVWADVNGSWCWQLRNHVSHIFSDSEATYWSTHGLPGIHGPSFSHSCHTATFAPWRCDDQGVWEAKGSGTSCDSSACWDYIYRRGGFQWSYVLSVGLFQRQSWAALTVRGNGQAVTGHKTACC